MNITQFHNRNLNKTKPIKHRLDRNRPKPVNTFARILCEMLYRATPINVLAGGYKEYNIHIGDQEMIVIARITSNYDEAPMYEIDSVRFACEVKGCDCPTEYFDNITYA